MSTNQLFSAKEIFALIEKEEEDIICQLAEEVDCSYDDAKSFLEIADLDETVGKEERRLVGEWNRISNLYFNINNLERQ